MAFKLPAGLQVQSDPAYHEAIADVLGHHNIGQWGSDHNKESKSYQGWNYVAIAVLGRQAARAHGYVYSAEPAKTAKRKAARKKWGSIWKSMAQDGSADTVPEDNWVARMVDQPNRTESGAMFRWEYIQQLHLHGCCLIWNRPTQDGSRTAARYIIPMALTQPVYPGQYENCPNGGIRLLHYQAGLGFIVNPLIRMLSGAILPVESLSVIRLPHPYLRGDGKSPTDAVGWWIDSALMVDMTRWKQLKRGPRPLGFVSFEDKTISEPELDAAEKRLNRKLQDEDTDQSAIAMGGGATLSRDTAPVDMEYVQAFDQLQRSILAGHGVGESAAGLSDNMTYGSLAASLMQTLTVVQGDLDLLGGEWTMLAQDEGATVSVEFETQPLDDPTLIEQQLTTDLTAGVRTMREWRAIRGLQPFGDWRDDARVTSTGLVVDEPQPPKKQGQPPLDGGVGGAANGNGSAAGLTSPFARSFGKSLSKAIPGRSERPGPVVAVDLDGTLAEYDGSFHVETIGEPISSAVDKLHRLKRAGCRIVIFTCREDNELLRGWLDSHGIPYDGINENPDVALNDMPSGKVFADVYWDDRAVAGGAGIEEIAALLPEGEVRDRLLRGTPAEEKPGAVMLELPPSVLELVKAEQAKIDPDSMVGDGLEEWPHVTLLYGIVGTPLKEVVDQVRRLDQIDVTFGPSGLFENDDENVLKVEVLGTAIHGAHDRLLAALPVVETYPDYQPHVTLGYIQKHGSVPDPRNELLNSAASLSYAVVVVGGQRVRVPLRGATRPVREPVSAPGIALAKSAFSERVDFEDPQTVAIKSQVESLSAELRELQKAAVSHDVGQSIRELSAVVGHLQSEFRQHDAGASKGVDAGLVKAIVDAIGGSLAKAYNPNQPRDANGRWVSSGNVAAAAGSIASAKKLFPKLAGGGDETPAAGKKDETKEKPKEAPKEEAPGEPKKEAPKELSPKVKKEIAGLTAEADRLEDKSKKFAELNPELAAKWSGDAKRMRAQADDLKSGGTGKPKVDRTANEFVLASGHKWESQIGTSSMTGKDSAELHNKQFGEWAKGASEKDIDAIAVYTGGSFSDMNDGLRGKQKMDSDNKQKIKDLDGAFQRAPELAEPMTVYRGGGDFENMLGSDPESFIGKTLTDKGFGSTSTMQNVADGFANNVDSGQTGRFEISLPKGTKALSPDVALGHESLHQHEVVLNRNSKYKVTGVDRKPIMSDGKQVGSYWVVQAELLL